MAAATAAASSQLLSPAASLGAASSSSSSSSSRAGFRSVGRQCFAGLVAGRREVQRLGDFERQQADFAAAVAAAVRSSGGNGRGSRGVVCMAKKSVGDLKEADLKGKRVFVRADLNVPL